MFKKIETYIRTEKLDKVKEKLHEVGIVGMTISNVQGHGRQGGINLSGRVNSYKVDWLDRTQLTIVVSEHNVELTTQTICKAANTGKAGDGIIFISDITDVVRISSGERGKQAMQYRGDVDNN